MICVPGIFCPFDTHTIGVISSEVIKMETMEKNKQPGSKNEKLFPNQNNPLPYKNPQKNKNAKEPMQF